MAFHINVNVNCACVQAWNSRMYVTSSTKWQNENQIITRIGQKLVQAAIQQYKQSSKRHLVIFSSPSPYGNGKGITIRHSDRVPSQSILLGGTNQSRTNICLCIQSFVHEIQRFQRDAAITSLLLIANHCIAKIVNTNHACMAPLSLRPRSSYVPALCSRLAGSIQSPLRKNQSRYIAAALAMALALH